MDYLTGLSLKLIVLFVILNSRLNIYTSMIGLPHASYLDLSVNISATPSTFTPHLHTPTNINSSLTNLPFTLLLCRSSTYFYRPRERRSLSAVVVSLLLLLGGVEVNPGPVFNMGSLNVRSGINKAALIHSLIAEYQIEIFALCETWTSTEDPPAILLDFAPTGYRVHHVSRPSSTRGRRGGGLAIIVTESTTVKPISLSFQPTTFEIQAIQLRVGRRTIVLINTYRPPNSSPSLTFYSELADSLAEIATSHSHDTILCGDLNCPGTVSGMASEQLIDILHNINFIQYINKPTRENNLLDIIASNCCNSVIISTAVHESSLISDHRLVTASLNLSSHTHSSTTRTWRPLHSIDYTALDNFLISSPLVTNPIQDVDTYALLIEKTLVNALDKVAPVRKSTRIRRSQPCDDFLSDAAITAKRERRRLERLWKRTNEENNRIEYRAACRTANNLINESRTNFLSNRINAVSNSCKDKWKHFNNILHTNSSKISLGLSENPATFCNKLASFFTNKILKLNASNLNFLSGLSSDPFAYDLPSAGLPLDTFTPVTPAEVIELISSLQIKYSPVDPFPSSIIKSCSKSFSIIISNLANYSFIQGRFPLHYKLAQITPILKKPQLNPDDLASYRPISNLNTISKILERLALARLSPFILASSNFNPLQSAYRKKHSTETCIIKTLSDVYKSIEAGTSTLAVSLDLSAAFDTVCHSTLLTRLENSFGISGVVLKWISSYISDRSQFISAEDHKSSTHSLTFGVPQGSVLGPLLFTTYTSPTSHLVSSFGLSQQQYADDTIIYLSLSKLNPHCSISILENCLSALRLWFAQNSLTINPSKSVSTVFSTAQRIKKLNTTGIKTVSVAGSSIQIENDSTTLGVIFDSTLSFNKHVKQTVRSSNYHLRALRHIRHILTDDNAKTIGAALVHSKLDYANAILSDTSQENIKTLQRVQNSLARIVASPKRPTSSEMLLSSLHWLPIKSRITYKIACLTHTAFYERQPSYLSNLIQPYNPPRHMRSSDQYLLTVPRTRFRISDKSFVVAAPKIWNSLPYDLRIVVPSLSFRSLLKTHLFDHPTE